MTFSFSPLPPRPASFADPDAGTNHYKKDELVSFEVHAGAAIDWGQVVSVPPAQSRACDAGCKAFDLDLASVPFPMLRGQVTISARWLDGGLLSPDASVAISVSRLRWSVSLGLDAGVRVTAPPALDPVGTLYVPVVRPQPAITAITPEGVIASWPTTAPVTTLMSRKPPTGRTRLLTVEQPNSAQDSLRAYFTDDGGSENVTPYQAPAGTRFVGAAASVEVPEVDGGFGVYAVLQLADGGGSLIRFNPVPPVDGTVVARVVPSGSPGNVVADRTSIYVGERDQVYRFPSFDAGTVGTVSAQFRGLCLSEQTGMNLIATSTTPNNELHHASGSYPLPDGGVGAPLFGRGRGWLWINGTPSTLSTFVLPLPSSPLQKVVETPMGVVFQGSPAMGALRDGGSPLVYVATSEGLLVIDALDGGYWSMPGSPTADQPLSLDCARSSDGGGRSDRPGTLYTVSSSGIVTALIVDSQGLDGLAAWPRWQRSAGNTGSMVTALNPGCP